MNSNSRIITPIPPKSTRPTTLRPSVLGRTYRIRSSSRSQSRSTSKSRKSSRSSSRRGNSQIKSISQLLKSAKTESKIPSKITNEDKLFEMELKDIMKTPQKKKDKIFKNIRNLLKEEKTSQSYRDDELKDYLNRLITIQDECYRTFRPMSGRSKPWETYCSELDDTIKNVKDRLDPMWDVRRTVRRGG
jgi:hypothetical protein